MTKKYLIPYYADRGATKGKQILAPVSDDTGLKIASLPKGRETALGMVVYGGRELSASDLLAKIGNSESKTLLSDDEYTQLLEFFLKEVSRFKIGDVVKLTISSDNNVIFEKYEIEKPTAAKSKLP